MLRARGIDTRTEHYAHGFRTSFSTLCHHEEFKEARAWDGDVIELQLAHLENGSVKAIYRRHGPLARIGSRAKPMQHWADGIDGFADLKKSSRSQSVRTVPYRQQQKRLRCCCWRARLSSNQEPDQYVRRNIDRLVDFVVLSFGFGRLRCALSPSGAGSGLMVSIRCRAVSRGS